MTPSTIMAALVEIESAEDRARIIARHLGVMDEGAVELLRRALEAEHNEGWYEAQESEEW